MPKVSVKVTGLPAITQNVETMQEGVDYVQTFVGSLEDKDYRIQWLSKREIDGKPRPVSVTLQNRDSHKYAKVKVIA